MILSNNRLVTALRWIPSYLYQSLVRKDCMKGQQHLILVLANHFEPYILPHRRGAFAGFEVQIARVRKWIRYYEDVFERYRDIDGSPLKHTYFFPAEHYHPDLLALLSEHCAKGWGEVEIHLHHGVAVPDTPEGVCNQLRSFRDILVKHGCLSRMDGIGDPRYGFVHGNFALANSGRACGVSSELQILSQTGCYADFTLPSWPNRAQTRKINSVYECGLPLHTRAAHRLGRNLAVGRRPTIFPLIIQGPLMLNFATRKWGLLPSIDNSALTGRNPPTSARLNLWRRARISVEGRPNWIFIKLHCHGMDPRDYAALLGEPMLKFLTELREICAAESLQTHFVSTRELVNIILAACDARSGSPNNFRDYRLKLIRCCC